jgi:hypothetical protein
MALATEGGPKLEISIEYNQAFCRFFFLSELFQPNGSSKSARMGKATNVMKSET